MLPTVGRVEVRILPRQPVERAGVVRPDPDRGRLRGRVVGVVRGIPIVVHPSTLLTLALVWVWGFSGLGRGGAGLDTMPAVVIATVLAVAFFASILTHELAHALVARALGQAVSGVALFLLGGYTRLDSEAADARTEFTVALVGPLANLTLAGLLVVAGETLFASRPLAGGTMRLLGELNALVALFNLLPGHPLDGGVLVRAAAWAWRGDRTAAARASAWVGAGLGYLLITLGAAAAIVGDADLAGTGVWSALVGLFILGAARTASTQASVRGRLAGVRVSELFEPAPWLAPSDWTVGRVVADVVRGVTPGLVLESGAAVGWFGPEQLATLPSARYDLITLGEVMQPVAAQVSRDDGVLDVLAAFGGSADAVVVVEVGGAPIGSLRARTVIARLSEST